MTIRRGFHRIGLLGFGFFATIAIAGVIYDLADWAWWAKTENSLSVGVNLIGTFIGIFSVIIGALFYGACRALSWIIEGFRR